MSSLRVGVIGAGQLARMMIPAAVNLGVDLQVFAASEYEPASLAATSFGDFRNVEQILRFASGVDVLTFDHEHVPLEVVRAVEAAGVRVAPGSHALAVVQDKLVMRARLEELNVPSPVWRRVKDAGELEVFLSKVGGTAVMKLPVGGYDGRGVRIVRDCADVDGWWSAPGSQSGLLVEEKVEFRRELAQLIARTATGACAVWSLVESTQRDGVCREVVAPAPETTQVIALEAARIATEIADSLDVVGVLAVELFETYDGRLLVNELAMRPHNSGHWTMDGSVTSQFEQHLRAVLDLPLGAVDARAPWTVMANILGGESGKNLSEQYDAVLAEYPDVKIHNYAKTVIPGRKVGHVNLSGDDIADVVRRARLAAAQLSP